MDSQIEKRFYEYLIAQGFSSKAIVFEPALDGSTGRISYRPDFAILDVQSNEPIVLFEVKGRTDKISIKQGLKQIQSYVLESKVRSLRFYFVTPGENDELFNFYTLDQDLSPRLVPSSFLLPDSLLAASLSEKKGSLVVEKRKSVDHFKLLCFVAAFVSFCIAIADFICSQHGITILTTERLALLGVAVILLVIPYLQTFKALGIEIERFASKDG